MMNSFDRYDEEGSSGSSGRDFISHPLVTSEMVFSKQMLDFQGLALKVLDSHSSVSALRFSFLN